MKDCTSGLVKGAWQSICGTCVSPVRALAVAAAVGCSFTVSADVPLSAYVQMGLVIQYDGSAALRDGKLANLGLSGDVFDLTPITPAKDTVANGWIHTETGWWMPAVATVPVVASGGYTVEYYGRQTGNGKGDATYYYAVGSSQQDNSGDLNNEKAPFRIGSRGKDTREMCIAALTAVWGSNVNSLKTTKCSLLSSVAATRSGTIKVDTKEITYYENGAFVDLAKSAGLINEGIKRMNLGDLRAKRECYWIGDFGSVRVYNRTLTADEVARNAAVDAARFGGQPDRYRLNSETDKIEVLVTAECQGVSGSTVALNGGTAAQSASCWVEYGSTLSIAVAPAAGTSLIKWEGDTPTAGGAAGTYTITVKSVLSLAAICCKTEKTWNGAEGDLWSDGSKWSPTGVPEEGDLAVIPAGKTVTVDASTAKLGFLDVSGTVVCSGWTTCVEADDVVVRNGGKVTCVGPATTAEAMSRVYLKAGNIAVEQGGSVDVTGLGWKGGDADNNCGYGPGTVPNASAMAAGSHGGIGSLSAQGETTRQAVRTNVYGNATAPETAGSGGCGGRDKKGGAGGGVIRLDASGRVTVNGSVIADGKPGVGANWGAGAGGSVYITCKTFAGAHGKVTVAGASGTTHNNSWTSHSGSGGRLAIIFNKADQEKEPVPVDMKYSADCGPYHRLSEGAYPQAQQGTLYFSSDTLIDRRGATLFGRIDFADVTTKWTVDSFRLTNGWASLARDGVEMEVTGDFEVTGKSLVCRRVYGDDVADSPKSTCTPDTNGTRWDIGGNEVFAYTNRYPYYYQSAAVPKLTVGGDFKVSSNGIVQVFAGPVPLYPAEPGQSASLTNLGAVVSVTGALRLFETGKVYCASHPYTGASPSISAATLAVDAGSFVSADDRGYLGSYNNNARTSYNKDSLSPSWPRLKCGASHGGLGGWGPSNNSTTTEMGPTFDSTEWPVLPGPGGHSNYNSNYGPRGAGVVRIFVTGDAVTDGSLQADANAKCDFSGGGAGGSVLLTCRTVTGSGTFSARGADGYVYTPDANKTSTYHGGGGGGGRIAVHYDTEAQPALLTFTFLTSGGVGYGNGKFAGNGKHGTIWLTDDRLINGTTDFRHKGALFVPGKLASYTAASLKLEDTLFDIAPGGFIDIAGDITMTGSNVSDFGVDLSNGWLRCGGNLNVAGCHIRVVSDGTAPRANRFAVAGDVTLDGTPLEFTPAETENDVEVSIGGTLSMTNGATVRLQSPCDPVEGEPGFVFTAGGLQLSTNCWIYPYSHNTNGASCLFRIQEVALAAGGGFDATAMGYGSFEKKGSVVYGPATTPTDGRGTSDYNATRCIAPGYGGEGGMAVQPGATFLGTKYPRGRGIPYGSRRRPVFPGLGGAGNYSNIGSAPTRGGGLVRIESDVFHMNGGSLLANGTKPGAFMTGSSGGGVYVRARKFFGENGIIEAKGGDGAYYGFSEKLGNHKNYTMAAGGGGRIAVCFRNEYDEATNVTTSVAGGSCPLDLKTSLETYGEDLTELKAKRDGKEGTVYWGQIHGMRLIVR